MKLGYLAALAAMMMAISSCSSPKNSLTYFEDIKTSETGEFPIGDYDIKIMPDDELLISVSSTEPAATAIYNLPMVNPATRDAIATVTTPQQQTYRVDKDGDINFPVLGELHVEGLTIKQLTDELVAKISIDVADPMVLVELVNFRVNVLGEVANPGAVKVDRERYSVLDALADAGDLTPYGERSNVLIIREEGGKRMYHRINLNDSKLLSSPYFYLQQNDAIVVEPNVIRKDNAKYNQNNAYKLSVISTIVSACSIIASLVIALAVK